MKKDASPPIDDASDTAAGPLVSVVIPARNAAATIARAIDSVLAQTWRPLEIIVIDDASDDGMGAIVAAYDAPFIHLIRLDRQGGASGARNAGIAAAAGPLVAFLDADDEWLPTKLAKQAALIEADARCVFVSCATREISPDGADIGDLYHGDRPIVGAAAWKGLLAANTIATPSVLTRRRVLLELGGFDATLTVAEDQDLWIRLALVGELGFVDEPLVRAHTREDSLCSLSFAVQFRDTMAMLSRHLAAQRDRLTRGEARWIMGARLARLGRAACREDYRTGCRLLLRAAAYGHHPLGSVLHLLEASPPARWLKRRGRKALRALS
jgi:glycosyltransferase involved in cell wall biosynthesis